MKKLVINREELNKVVSEAVDEMINFSWNGWGIDILINEKGDIWSSAKNSGNMVYIESYPLLRVESWTFGENDWADESDASYNETNKLIDGFESKDLGHLDDLQNVFDVEF